MPQYLTSFSSKLPKLRSEEFGPTFLNFLSKISQKEEKLLDKFLLKSTFGQFRKANILEYNNTVYV